MILAVSAAAGAFLWSFVEYVLHRFRGHAPKGTSLFKKEHLAHHAKDYFTPTKKKIVMATPAIAAVAAAAVGLLGPAAGAAFAGGFVVAYVGYEVCHRRLHTHAPRGRFGRHLRRHHLHHHFVDARVNHGVTSALWDRVFGTYVKTPRVSMPPARSPLWMFDRDSGELLDPAFAADYEPRRRRRAS